MSAFTQVEQGRSAQSAARLLGLVLASVIALVALLTVGSPSAQAAFVANPGSFDSSFAGGYLKVSTFDPFEVGEEGELGDITLNGGTMNANGTYVVPKQNVIFPDLDLEAIDVGGIGSINPVVKIAASSDVTGIIDPETGEMTLNLDLTINIRGVSPGITFGGNGNCYIGSPSNPVKLRATTSNSGGIPYNPGTGRGRVSDNTFIVPKASGCGTIALIVNVNDQLNSQLGLNDQVAGSNQAELELETHPAFFTRAGLNLTTKPANATNQKNANFAFTSDVSAGLDFECRLDTGAWTPCNSKTASYTNLNDGSHTFQARALIGGSVLESVSHTWSIDTVQPVYTVSGAPTGLVNTRNANITFTVNKTMPAGSARCSLDGAAATPCTSPQNLTGLADGNHTFTVSGTDSVGNSGSTTRNWTVDATKPTVDITSGPIGVSSTAEVNFTFTAVDNMTANPAAQCQVRNLKDNSIVQAWTNCSSPYIQVRPTGRWQLQVRATDNAGNVADVKNFDWQANTAEPVIIGDTYTFNGDPTIGHSGGTTSSDAEFEFDAATYELDENDEPVVIPGTEFTYECWLDGNSLGACDSPMTLHDLTGGTPLAQGTHVFEVKPTTVASPPVQGTPTAFEWKVDTVTPTASFADAPSLHNNSSTATFVLDIDGTGSQGTAQCKLDNQNWSDCDSNTAHDVNVADGNHTLLLRAVDQAGNQSQAVSHVWNADTVDPSVSINSTPTDNSPSNEATFGFETNDNDNGVQAICQLDSGLDFPCDSRTSHTLTGVSDGVHTITVTAKDRAGNTSSADHTWRVDTTAPALSITAGPDPLITNTNAAFKYQSSDSGSGIASISCRVDGGTWVNGSECQNGNIWNFFPGPFGSGDHTFQVRSIDNAGNQTNRSWQWKVDHTAPDVAISTKLADSKSTNAVIEFLSSESDAIFECKVDAGSFEFCTSPMTLTNLSVGNHVFSVRAVDQAGNRSADDSLAWKVNGEDPQDPTCEELGKIGTWPNCETEPCPPNTTGTPPNCVPDPDPCPVGTTGTPPNCIPDKCPDGQIGTPPNCENKPLDKCAANEVGTPPNCKATLPPVPNPTNEITTYNVKTGKLGIRLKCPAGLKPKCIGTAVAVAGKGKNAKVMSNRVKNTSKAGGWKLVTLTIKPAFRNRVALMATVNKKQLIIKQTLRSQKVKKKRTVFHTYKVRVKG